MAEKVREDTWTMAAGSAAIGAAQMWLEEMRTTKS
jgi:hypothetical protein